MKRVLGLFIAAMLLSVHGISTVHAQKVDLAAEAAAIRALAQRPQFTDDVIFWSGAFPRPMIGREDGNRVKPFPEERVDQRRNQRKTDEIIRLEVAAGGDLAYEFSNFTFSYDMADTKEHVSFTGSALRVWKKVNGQWRVAAAFLRPHDVPFAAQVRR